MTSKVWIRQVGRCLMTMHHFFEFIVSSDITIVLHESYPILSRKLKNEMKHRDKLMLMKSHSVETQLINHYNYSFLLMGWLKGGFCSVWVSVLGEPFLEVESS